MFVVEGVPAVLLGFVVMWWLPDRPAGARWLSSEERTGLETALRRDAPPASHLREGLASARIWALALVYFGLVIGLYGLGFWAPQIIRTFGGLTNRQIGLLTAVPYLFAGIAMVVWGRHSDATGERIRHVTIPAWIGAAGFALSALALPPAASLAALTAGATSAALQCQSGERCAIFSPSSDSCCSCSS